MKISWAYNGKTKIICCSYTVTIISLNEKEVETKFVGGSTLRKAPYKSIWELSRTGCNETDKTYANVRGGYKGNTKIAVIKKTEDSES